MVAPDAVTHRERAEWAELEGRSVEANAFLSPYFVLPALRHLDAGRRALVCFVRSGTGVASVLRGLGVFCEAKPSRAFPLPHLLAYRSCHSYLSGLLVDREGAQQTVDAMLSALTRKTAWHGLVIERCRAEGAVCVLLRAAAARRKIAWRESPGQARAILRPADAGERYLTTRLGSRLAEPRRQLRRLRDEGPVRWDAHRSGPALDRCVDRHLELEGEGWKGDDQTALVSHPAHTAFFRAMVEGFAREERALLTELAVGDEIIATTSNLISGDAAFSFKIGWAKARARASPGVLNEIEFIRNASEVCRGLSYVDSGAEPGSFIERLWLDRYQLTNAILPLSGPGGVSMKLAALARLWPRDRSPSSDPAR